MLPNQPEKPSNCSATFTQKTKASSWKLSCVLWKTNQKHNIYSKAGQTQDAPGAHVLHFLARSSSLHSPKHQSFDPFAARCNHEGILDIMVSTLQFQATGLHRLSATSKSEPKWIKSEIFDELRVLHDEPADD